MWTITRPDGVIRSISADLFIPNLKVIAQILSSWCRLLGWAFFSDKVAYALSH